MDLSKFDSITQAEAGVPLKLADPKTGADTGAEIILYGADSHIYKQAKKEIDARNRNRGGRALSSEEASADAAELIARCTKGWRGIEENGKELPFSQDEAKRVYLEYPEIGDRVAAFIFSRMNFFGSASRG